MKRTSLREYIEQTEQHLKGLLEQKKVIDEAIETTLKDLEILYTTINKSNKNDRSKKA